MELGSSDEVGSGHKTLGWSWGQVTKLAVDRKHSDGVGGQVTELAVDIKHSDGVGVK